MELVECHCEERRCKHFIGIASREEPDFPKDEEYNWIQIDIQCYICEAFPIYPGIPNTICAGIDLHVRPWKTTNDYFKDQKNKIVYEKED